MIIGHRSLVIGHWSLVIGHWSVVIGHWSWVIWSFGHLSFDHLVSWSFRPSFGNNRGKILGDNRGKIFGDIKGIFFFAPEGQRDFLLRPGFRGNGATNLGAPRQKSTDRSALLKHRVRTPSGDPVGHPFGENMRKTWKTE